MPTMLFPMTSAIPVMIVIVWPIVVILVRINVNGRTSGPIVVRGRIFAVNSIISTAISTFNRAAFAKKQESQTRAPQPSTSLPKPRAKTWHGAGSPGYGSNPTQTRTFEPGPLNVERLLEAMLCQEELKSAVPRDAA